MRIDVHTHYWTDECLDLLADLGKTAAGTLRGLDAGDGQELDARLRLIDRAGPTRRCSPPRRSCLTLMGRVKAVAAACFVNDQYAALAERRPGRFRAFAAIPMPHIAARRSPNWDAPRMGLVWNPDRYCWT
jgi:6-methylsalicylate decarboxylase